MVGVTLLLLAAGGVWAWQQRVALQAFPDILGAFTAKEYCSCRYVMQRQAPDCRAYARQYVPITSLDDDVQQRRVEVQALGRRHVAAWQGPQWGCRLEPAAGP